MTLSFGAFKQVYRGQGIYWAGTYNVEGNGQYATLAAVKAAIDAHIDARNAAEREAQETAVANGAIRARKDTKADTVTLTFPNNTVETMPAWKFRRDVFAIESRWGADVVFIGERG